MSGRSFEDNLKMGEVARNWVVAKLIADRWSVVPLDEITPRNGHGPQASGRGGPLTLPDLQATKAHNSIAVEVKGKTAASAGRLSGEPEHGVDQRHYDDYCEYDRAFMPTFIVVVELGAAPEWMGRATFAARVIELRPRLSRDLSGTPMAYWPRSQMTTDWLMRLNRNVVYRNRPPRKKTSA